MRPPTLVARPVSIMPTPNMLPPTSKTPRGPSRSLMNPPEIMVMGPTALATVNTMARSAAVTAWPSKAVSFAASGAENTLHA